MSDATHDDWADALAEQHSTHFAVPPMAIPILGEEPLVIYGQGIYPFSGEPIQVRLQCSSKKLVISIKQAPQDQEWKEVWVGTWGEFPDDLKFNLG